jgi:hypothetical protein
VIGKLLFKYHKILHNYLTLFRTQLLLREVQKIIVISMCSNLPLPPQITQLLHSSFYKKYVLWISTLLITKSNSTCKEISDVDISDKIDCLSIGREKFVDCCLNSPWQYNNPVKAHSLWSHVTIYYLHFNLQ